MRRFVFFSILYVLIVLSGATVYSQNQKSEIINRGAVQIAELEWQLDPGWWQYHPSCDGRKWISNSQTFEPRTDQKASCDQQIHDYETVVAPTLSKTAEAIVPADGTIIVLYEIKQGKDYDKEPWINSSLYTPTGVETNMLYNMVGGTKKLLETDQYPTASKGDKVVLKVDARLRDGSGKRFLLPQGVKLIAYLIPTNGSLFLNNYLNKPQPGILYYSDKECN